MRARAAKGSYPGSTTLGHVAKPSAKEYLRGVHRRKYKSGLLTQDRVRQMFGFDVKDGSNYYGEVEDSKDSNYELELDERHFVPEEGYQYEMNLVNVDELEGKLTDMIRRYEDAIHAMAADALQWADLMNDLDEDEHLAKEFDKFQMLRKLSGGTM